MLGGRAPSAYLLSRYPATAPLSCRLSPREYTRTSAIEPCIKAVEYLPIVLLVRLVFASRRIWFSARRAPFLLTCPHSPPTTSPSSNKKLLPVNEKSISPRSPDFKSCNILPFN